jgi:hypothetical protein
MLFVARRIRRSFLVPLAGGLFLGAATVAWHAHDLWAFVLPPVTAPPPKVQAVPVPPAARLGSTARPAALPVARGAVHREELGGCRPDQDLSCTVIRETASGFIVFTRAYRDGSQAAVLPSGGDGQPGVCVMPSPPVPSPTATARYPNGAPILD